MGTGLIVKKKRFVELPPLSVFMHGQSNEIKCEYIEIVEKLEREGRLSMPFAEKLTCENLFAIRIIHAGNVRVFYAYGKQEWIYGLCGYVKKTSAIPGHELKKARYILKILIERGKA